MIIPLMNLLLLSYSTPYRNLLLQSRLAGSLFGGFAFGSGNEFLKQWCCFLGLEIAHEDFFERIFFIACGATSPRNGAPGACKTGGLLSQFPPPPQLEREPLMRPRGAGSRSRERCEGNRIRWWVWPRSSYNTRMLVP